MIALSSLWYNDHDQSSFHFFNDNNEWLQMDKVGHIATSYQLGRLGIEALRWTGVENKKAIWYGGSLGFVFLTSVEIFDGFSSAWGASWGDVLSNTAGTAILIGQEFIFEEQVVSLKYSFSRTKFPNYRPNVLGANWNEELLKDYNGQTYWVSVNLHALYSKKSIPKWLNVAVGYGAHGMISGTTRSTTINDNQQLPEFERYRQYYLSLDVDMTKIKTKSKWMNTIFSTIGFLKFPFPALEWNSVKGVQFHPFFY